jgi:hypothetical protein
MKAVDAKRLSRWTAYAMLGLALLTAALDLPNRVASVVDTLPVVRLLYNPDEQYRLQLADVPYDLLRAADAALPNGATVLLVTPGRDTDTLEYISYHRALYFLAPRSVWWAAPTLPDGTWKSRWWISTPLTSEALRALAADKGASYVLVFGVSEPLLPGQRIVEQPDGYLLQLDEPEPTPVTLTTMSNYAGPLWPLGILLAVAVPLALGSLALYLVGRLGYRAGGLEALSLAWALGAGLLTLLMLYLSALGLNLGWQMAIGLVVAVIALLPVGRAMLLRWWPMTVRTEDYQLAMGTTKQIEAQSVSMSPAVYRHMAHGVQYLLLALLALQLVLAAIPAVGRPLDVWDSWVNWGVKSRAIFLEGHISPAVYADASRTVTHLDYPLLVPLLQSWFYGWLGAPDDRFAGVASVLFYAALVGICYAAVRGRGGSRTLSLAAAATVGTISQLAGLASIVFAEMPLAVFATISGVYLLKWLEGGPPGALLLSALGAGLLCWTKRDGILFLVAILLAVALTGWRHRRAWQGVSVLAVATLVVAGPWYVFAALNSRPAPDFQSFDLGTLASNIRRWSTIVELEWNSLTNQNWSYIWPLAVLSGILFWVVRRERKPVWAALVPIAVVTHLALSGAVFFFSAFVPYEQHILGSIDRLVVQVAPLVVVWIALQAVPATELPAHVPQN